MKTFMGVVLTFSFLLNLYSISEISREKFRFKGNTNEIVVKKLGGQTDVFLYSDNEENLSSFYPGENLFPKIFVWEDCLSITWINYNSKYNLVIYDRETDSNNIFFEDEFSFISSDTELVYKEEQIAGVLFRAIKSNSKNEDIFFLNLRNENLIKITNTPLCEKRITLKDISDLPGIITIETETLEHVYEYKIDMDNSDIELLGKYPIYTGPKNLPTESHNRIKTLVAFGDSITWGKMRMNDLEDLYHPELTYWANIVHVLSERLHDMTGINLGIPGNCSYDGVKRLQNEFENIDGYYCFIMFGTNDVTRGEFSCVSTCENIKYIYSYLQSEKGMCPIYITIPPQKKYKEEIQFFKENTEALNRDLMKMARENNFYCVDIYNTFLNYEFGWEMLLEDVKGNHPSPKGHQVISDRILSQMSDLFPFRDKVYLADKKNR